MSGYAIDRLVLCTFGLLVGSLSTAAATTFGTPDSSYITLTHTGCGAPGLGCLNTHSATADGVPVPLIDSWIQHFTADLVTLNSTYFQEDRGFGGGGGVASAAASFSGGFIRMSAKGIPTPGVTPDGSGGGSTGEIGFPVHIVAPTGGLVAVTMHVHAEYNVPRSATRADMGGFLRGREGSAAGSSSPLPAFAAVSGQEGAVEREATVSLAVSAGAHDLTFVGNFFIGVQGAGVIDATNTAFFTIDVPGGFEVTSPLRFGEPAAPPTDVPITSTLQIFSIAVGALALGRRRRGERDIA